MKYLVRPIDWLASAPLLVLIAIFNAAVLMRYWFGQPIQWTEEMSGLLMIWIVMIGAVAAERDDQHLSISVFTDLLPAKVGAIFNIVVSLLSVGIILYVGWVGYRLAMKVQFKVTDILRISWVWIDIAVPVGCAGIAFYMLYRSFITARGLFAGSEK